MLRPPNTCQDNLSPGADSHVAQQSKVLNKFSSFLLGSHGHVQGIQLHNGWVPGGTNHDYRPAFNSEWGSVNRITPCGGSVAGSEPVRARLFGWRSPGAGFPSSVREGSPGSDGWVPSGTESGEARCHSSVISKRVSGRQSF